MRGAGRCIGAAQRLGGAVAQRGWWAGAWQAQLHHQGLACLTQPVLVHRLNAAMDEATLERALCAVKGIGEQAMAVGVLAGLLREGMSPGHGSFAVKLCILVSTS